MLDKLRFCRACRLHRARRSCADRLRRIAASTHQFVDKTTCEPFSPNYISSRCSFRTFAGEESALDGSSPGLAERLETFRQTCLENRRKNERIVKLGKDTVLVKLKTPIRLPEAITAFGLFLFPRTYPQEGDAILGVVNDNIDAGDKRRQGTVTGDGWQMICTIKKVHVNGFRSDCDCGFGCSGGRTFWIRTGMPPVAIGTIIATRHDEKYGSPYSDTMFTLHDFADAQTFAAELPESGSP